VVLSAVAGVCAWVGANFFAEPLLFFYKRRREIRESMLYVANVDASRKKFMTQHMKSCVDMRLHLMR
jgi:hypothetical protein